jgi:hypothetical protein
MVLVTVDSVRVSLERMLRKQVGRTMIRRCLMISAVTLALIAALTVGVAESAGPQARSDVTCSMDLGVRVTLNVGSGTIRASIAVPGMSVWLGSSDSLGGWLEPSALQVASVSLNAGTVLRWGIPILNTVAGVVASGAGRL